MFLLVRQMVYQPDRFKFGPTDYFCPHISVPKKVLGLSRDSNPGVGVNFLSIFMWLKGPAYSRAYSQRPTIARALINYNFRIIKFCHHLHLDETRFKPMTLRL